MSRGTGGVGVWDNITKCHVEEEGGLRSAKKCHESFEWPLCSTIECDNAVAKE